VPYALITPPSAAARLDRTTGWLRRRPPSERALIVAASVDAARRLEPLRRLA
jgi:hypothetical protein